MRSFLNVHRSEIKGVLSGFGRVRFRGTLRWLAHLEGMGTYLWSAKVLLKDFVEWSKSLTAQVRAATERLAEAAGRPLQYLASSQQRKEDLAREIAAADGITDGLVCVLTCVEPCLTCQIGRNAEAKRLELARAGWGLMHLRLQTWLPFTINVCLNGRAGLAQQMRRAGIPYEQRDNCFVDVGDFPRAQQLLNAQLRTPWVRLLDELRQQTPPSPRPWADENGRDSSNF